MRKYGIHSARLTIIGMARWNLVTKEKMKQAYKGELKNERGWRNQESVHDDLETFFKNLLDSKEPKEEDVVWSFFTPKLTKEELKLVEERNEDFMSTLYLSNPDVDPKEMKLSDLKSKYLRGYCRRHTCQLNLE